MSTSPPSSPAQSALARAQQREYQRSEYLSSLTTTPAQSTSRQWQHARLEMFTPPTPTHATSSRALQNERWRLEMSSDSSNSSTPAPSTETLFGDFRVLEQECKKLEKVLTLETCSLLQFSSVCREPYERKERRAKLRRASTA